MPKFRNISPDALNVGAPDGPTVDADGVFEPFGEIAEETGDAYIVRGVEVTVGTDGDGNPVRERELRAWPKSIWRLVGSEDPPAKSANKPDWVVYAVSRGQLPEAAEAMSKDQLVAEYGTDTEGGSA